MSATSKKSVIATEGLQFCNKLFAIERVLKELDPKDRYEKRLEKSKPVLDAFLVWLKIQEKKVLPKSALGKAITKCLNQWDKLVAFLEDGRLEIDNRLNPYYYLRFLFEQLPNMDLADEKALDKLLPWSPSVPVNCVAFNKLSK